MIFSHDILGAEVDQIASAQLVVDAEVEKSSSRTLPFICGRTRRAQMSFSLNGAFFPTSLPLLHGSR